MRCSHAALDSRVALAPVAQTHTLQRVPLPCPGSRDVACVCTGAWKHTYTLTRDAILSVRAVVLLLVCRHGLPAMVSAQKPVVVLDSHLPLSDCSEGASGSLEDDVASHGWRDSPP